MITVPERRREFVYLRGKVLKQIDYCRDVHPTLGGVEVCVVNTPTRNNGGPSIGIKRTLGLKIAKGQYVVWLDDDDDIAPNYVETILRLANKGADVCTFNNVSKFHNYWCVVKMSLDVKHDDQTRPGIVNRRPYHVCGWRRAMIEHLSFPDTNWDEDTGFILQALKLAKTEAHSEAVLHEYRRVSKSYAE